MKIAETQLQLRFVFALCGALSFGCELIVGDLPDPAGDEGSSGGRAGTSSGGRSGSGGSSGGGHGGQDAGADADAGVSGTGGEAGAGGSSGCEPECDCDRDGQRAASNGCGGPDCDDEDPNVFWGQTLFFAERSRTQGFDYNCDGMSQREHPTVVNCNVLRLLDCPVGQQGFLASVSCGDPGEWGQCKAALTCGKDVLDAQRIMRCR